jgi:16S rRNA (adenine1518-N6/adenine1519-N6)-dimethyltransferase
MVDPGTVRRIVAAAQLADGEQVVEIGPGLGSLTFGLLEAGASVAAIEVDSTLAGFLRQAIGPGGGEAQDLGGEAGAVATGSAAPRFTLLEADALDVTALPGRTATALVANLPYSVATKVLLRFLERFESIRHGLVLVQAEVAARLVAGPGSRTYGAPSAKLAWWAEARPAGRVPRNAFFPVPRVDSDLVWFERRQPPASRVPRERVFAVVDAAFATRRKTLRAALAGLAGGAERAQAALDAADVPAMARGETLGIEEFARLAEAMGDVTAAEAGAAPNV